MPKKSVSIVLPDAVWTLDGLSQRRQMLLAAAIRTPGTLHSEHSETQCKHGSEDPRRLAPGLPIARLHERRPGRACGIQRAAGLGRDKAAGDWPDEACTAPNMGPISTCGLQQAAHARALHPRCDALDGSATRSKALQRAVMQQQGQSQRHPLQAHPSDARRLCRHGQ